MEEFRWHDEKSILIGVLTEKLFRGVKLPPLNDFTVKTLIKLISL